MSKPRILFVTRYHFSRFTGGAELQCWMLATELARRGWEVHFASEMNRVPEPNPMDGVTLHGLPENPHWLFGNGKELEKLMRELEPDVVYNRVFDSYTGHSMRRAPQKTLTVWAAAAYGEAPAGVVLRKSWKQTSILPFFIRLPRLMFVLTRAFRGARAAKLALAQHQQQSEELSKYGIHANVVRNSVTFIPESEMQSHEGNPIVLWVGSIKSIKQPELFYELARRCQDLNTEFVMAGGVQNESARAELENATKSLSNFKYVGVIPSDEIGEYYRRAHLLVCTSKSEGFPNTFPQAWLRGVPVVTLKIDPDHLIQDRNLGCVAQNMNDLEQGIRALLANPDQRRDIGKRAREFAVKEFDLKDNVDKLEALFAERGVKRTN